MSIWANELAPNLFDSYDAWYRNYIKVCDCFPGTDELKVAEDYFKSINKPREKMSIKEAIWRIQDHRRIHSKKEPFTPKLDQAFDMAIQALERGEDNKNG